MLGPQLPMSQISVLMVIGHLHGARSARFFDDFRRVWQPNPPNFLESLHEETEGLGPRVISYHLSVELEHSES
jgi:hypothetical protein